MNTQAKVIRADRSPMNRKQWCLELDCGHEVWITATREPRKLTHECPRCTDELKALAERSDENDL